MLETRKPDPPTAGLNRAGVHPLDRRFAYVTGKGGVGKTTVSASLARSHAQRNRRVLLATTEPDHYNRLLPGAAWTSSPTVYQGSLSVVALSAEAAFEEYGKMLIRPRLARKALFGNRYAKGFLDAVPGLAQWAILGKAWYHCVEELDKRPRFDTVILDAPATGHGLQMLQLPRVIADIAPPGPLRRDAQRAWSLVSDPARTCVTVVGLPEELPTNETLELLAALREQVGIPAGLLVVNQVTQPLFTDRQTQWLSQLHVPTSTLPLGQTISAAQQRAQDDRLRQLCLDRLTGLELPTITLPQNRAMATQQPAELSEFLSDYFLPTPR